MKKNIILVWLILAATTVIIQILLGGYVRLTRSGLSMYDWNVITGIIPPLTEQSWQETFDNYKETPEYKKINVGMTLDEYKRIYFREYNHRILGRVTGLIFVVPLFLFLLLKWFNWRRSKIYLLTGLLFAGQGVLGWYMVKSGLVDQPSVSHYRLAAHLLMAFLILALIVWKYFDTLWEPKNIYRDSLKLIPAKPLLLFVVILILQVTYGAFVAGLKAGYVSDTFPLMFGFLIPPNLFDPSYSAIMNIFANGVTVHFIHRWLAFVVLITAFYAAIKLRKTSSPWFAFILPGAIIIQIILGLIVIWMHVPISVALIHQGGAIMLLIILVLTLHKKIAAKARY